VPTPQKAFDTRIGFTTRMPIVVYKFQFAVAIAIVVRHFGLVLRFGEM
jgi:hypothetical protein